MIKAAWFIVGIALLIVPASSWCQQQDQQKDQMQQGQQSPPAAQGQTQTPPAAQVDSLAAAARRAREQKNETPKASKVFTNDDIPTQGGVSTVGGASTGPSSENVTAAGSTHPKGNEEKEWRDKFAALRHKLDQDQAEIDVMQRELGVANVQYYSDPMKAMQQELTRGDIDKKTAEIEAKKKQVEADKQAIADTEDDLRKSGGDPGWAR
jgi:hypothetical protein